MTIVADFLYQARVYDASNNLLAIYDDLTSLYYKKQVNHVGMSILTVPETHDLVDRLTDDLLLEIFLIYDPLGAGLVAAQSDYLGLYRDKQIATDGDGNIYYLLYFPSTIEILSRYTIAWPAGTNDKTQWTSTRLAVIANNIVQYNCTEEATAANGRIRDATRIRTLNDQGAIAGTPTVNYTVSNRNVLEVMQELAPICGFDFDVVRNGGTPANLDYKQYTGQLGSDLTASIIFDLALDNVANANLNGDRLREKTAALVGGQGEGSARTFVTRTGDNYGSTNDYEFFVDARTAGTTIELNTIGDAKLGELKARSQLNASVAPSFGYMYKRDYGLGDLVTVKFGNVSATRKIDRVEVKFDQDQRADIQIGFADLP